VLHPPGSRSSVVADLVRSFEAYFAEHRVCGGLAGSIVEVAEKGVLWGVAWMECSDCGEHWERRLRCDGPSLSGLNPPDFE
jgi:hypothetical protein